MTMIYNMDCYLLKIRLQLNKLNSELPELISFFCPEFLQLKSMSQLENKLK